MSEATTQTSTPPRLIGEEVALPCAHPRAIEPSRPTKPKLAIVGKTFASGDKDEDEAEDSADSFSATDSDPSPSEGAFAQERLGADAVDSPRSARGLEPAKHPAGGQQKGCLNGKVPTTPAAIALLFLSIVVISASGLAIAVTFSLKSAQELARVNAASGFSLCYDAIISSVSQPVQYANSLRFLAATLPPSQETLYRPGFNISNESWPDAWAQVLMLNMHRANFTLNEASIGFIDGGYVGCFPSAEEVNASLFSCTYVPTPPFDEELGFLPTERRDVKRKSDGVVLSTTVRPTKFIVYEGSWYVFTPRDPGDFYWYYVQLSQTNPAIPSVSFGMPVHDASGHYLGTTHHSINLNHLDAEFKSILSGFKVSAYLLDSVGLMIASSSKDGPFTSEIVSSDHELLPQEFHCVLAPNNASEGAYEVNTSTKICRKSPTDTNDPALVELYTRYRDYFSGIGSRHVFGGANIKSSVLIQRMRLAGDEHYVLISPLSELGNARKNNMNWRLVVLMREGDITAPILDGLSIALGVSVMLVVVVGLLAALVVHFMLLRPIARVAARMNIAFLAGQRRHSNHCNATGAGLASSECEPNAPQKPSLWWSFFSSSATEGDNQQRTPSYLAEIATIQKAFWGMSDELDLLKSFIPEHVLATRQMHAASGVGAKGKSQVDLSTSMSTKFVLPSARDDPKTAVALIKSREANHESPDAPLPTKVDAHRSFSNATRFSEPNVNVREVTVERRHNPVVELVDPSGRATYSRPQLPSNEAVDHARDRRPAEINPNEDIYSRDETPCVEVVDRDNAKERATPSSAHRDPSNPLALGRRHGHLHWAAEDDGTSHAVRMPCDNDDDDGEQRVAKDDDLSSPVYFGDNVLVDRDISVAVINIVQFHRYVLRHHGTDVARDHAELVRLVNVTAKRRGGILENFLGDRFIVSFNATSRCVHHAVAAACFALEISTVVNSAAIDSMVSTKAQRKSRRRERETRRKLFGMRGLTAASAPGEDGDDPAAYLPPTSFRAAPCGLTCGVATGRALVGPLGTDSFRRHTIISYAVPEACALERMAIRYPNCSVLMGGDMIPEVDGYCQYLIVDASLLPGSGGQRRRVASIKGMMCAPGRDPAVLKGLVDSPAKQLAVASPYTTINGAFNAFLEGRVGDCAARVAEHAAIIQKSKEVHVDDTGMEGEPHLNSEKFNEGNTFNESTNLLSDEQCADTKIVCDFLQTFLSAVDGRDYKASWGAVHAPIEVRVLYSKQEVSRRLSSAI